MPKLLLRTKTSGTVVGTELSNREMVYDNTTNEICVKDNGGTLRRFSAGGGGGGGATDWASITGKPSTFAPSAHTHLWAEITDKPTTFAPSTHSHASTEITDFTEAVQDVVGALLVAGTNVTLNYNDAANTLTINASGGGGSSNMARKYANFYGRH